MFKISFSPDPHDFVLKRFFYIKKITKSYLVKPAKAEALWS